MMYYQVNWKVIIHEKDIVQDLWSLNYLEEVKKTHSTIIRLILFLCWSIDYWKLCDWYKCFVSKKLRITYVRRLLFVLKIKHEKIVYTIYFHNNSKKAVTYVSVLVPLLLYSLAFILYNSLFIHFRGRSMGTCFMTYCCFPFIQVAILCDLRGCLESGDCHGCRILYFAEVKRGVRWSRTPGRSEKSSKNRLPWNASMARQRRACTQSELRVGASSCEATVRSRSDAWANREVGHQLDFVRKGSRAGSRSRCTVSTSTFDSGGACVGANFLFPFGLDGRTVSKILGSLWPEIVEERARDDEPFPLTRPSSQQ